MVVGYLSSTFRDAIAFGILILVLLLRPQGILGRAQKEKV
jgi:branched-chain amino acid transport system permease protein